MRVCLARAPLFALTVWASAAAACGSGEPQRGGRDAQVSDAHVPGAPTGSDAEAADATDAALDAGSLGDGSAPDTDSGPDGPLPEPDASLELGATFASRDPDYLFDPTALRTFDLYLSREDLAVLDADPTAEEYVPGRLAFEGGLVADVGIRYKGSAGSFLFCVANSFPPSGKKTCVKLGMKIKIDYLDDDARFFGQNKLQFHAMNLDASLLRERLSYGLFDALGVHASRTAHVRLRVNGKLVGIFLLVEVIDGPFPRGRFADGGGGNLYKEVWPVGLDEARYLAALENNKKDQPSAAKMVAFADALAVADDQTLPDVVEHWLDAEYAARFIAVDRTIRHDDGPHHWYCHGTTLGTEDAWQTQRSYAGVACGNHNYYWYEDSAQERLWPVPWDLDNAISPSNGFTTVLSAWDDLDVDCSSLLTPSFGSPQMPITCDPLHRGMALSLRERVASALMELSAGPLSEAELDAKLDAWVAQLEPAIREANAAQLSEPKLDAWKDNVQVLRDTLLRLRDEALAHARE
jgi:hypothetical protein